MIQAGEIRHGSLEIVESDVLFLFLVPTDSSRVITQRALKFVEKWKGTAIVLDYADFAMGLHDGLAPFVMFVPLEWFCYYFSIVRDHNPDDCIFHLSSASFPEIQSTQIRYFRAGISAL